MKKKYLYVKEIDRDILETLFDYKKYGSNPRLSDIEDFRLPEKLDWFFRTGEIPTQDTPFGKGKCSFYIDISKVNLNDSDLNFLGNISHVAIADRFEKTSYHKVDLLKYIPMNGIKKAMYCCIKFAKKYPNTSIVLTSKYNKCMKLLFKCTLEGNIAFSIAIYSEPDNPIVYIYGKDDISKFEEEVLEYYEC